MHSPSCHRNVVGPIRIAFFASALGLSGSVKAEPASGADYRRIEPKEPDVNRSAAVMAQLCSTILQAKDLSSIKDTCPDFARAVAFCGNPLDFGNPRLSSTELDALARNKCPTVDRVEPLRVGAKAMDGLFGLAWQDAVISGLAAFLVERAKVEALAAAADRFRNNLCGEDVARRILPLTCTLLKAADPYRIPMSWGQVKLTLEKDLHELPLRMLDLGIPRMTSEARDAPELLFASLDVLERVVAEKQSPLPLLVGLRTAYQDAPGACEARPVACALFVAGIASEAILPSFDPQNPPDRFAAFAARIILEEAKSAGILAGIWDAQAAASAAAKTEAAVSSVASSFAKLKSKSLAAKGSGAKSEAIGAYAAAVGDLFVCLNSAFGPILIPNQPSLKGMVQAVQAWPRLLRASLDRDYITAVLELWMLWNAAEQEKAPPWVLRYLPSLAELAQAKNPGQAKDVLQALAAPVGGYRGKRGAGSRQRTINAYVGGQGGLEWLGGSKVPVARSAEYGLFAPIGVETSWGFGEASSFSLLISVLDLGAVVSFRTRGADEIRGEGDEAARIEQKPQIGFSQVFSPGLYALWGISSTPLVLGLGGSLTPELRQATSVSGGAAEKATALRVGVFLAIDLTLLPL